MTADAREAQCPYPGLEAFTAENQHFFFGRRNDTQLLISNLYASALTVVYGSSGVGKTSVVLAGVVPEVEREGEAAILVHRTWQDAARARSLGDRMVQAVADKLQQPPIAADAPLDVLAERLAARWRRPLFLVFDQFEEYFLHNEPSDEPDSLDGELARLINRRDLAVNVMIVMREDSIAALDRFRHRIPTLLNNLYRLEHLTQHEARSAIEEPLAVLTSVAYPAITFPRRSKRDWRSPSSTIWLRSIHRPLRLGRRAIPRAWSFPSCRWCSNGSGSWSAGRVLRSVEKVPSLPLAAREASCGSASENRSTRLHPTISALWPVSFAIWSRRQGQKSP